MYFVRPKNPDLVIPMPTGGDLPKDGAILPVLDLYWTRRLSEKVVLVDVVEADTVETAIAELAAVEASTGKGRKAPADTEQKG